VGSEFVDEFGYSYGEYFITDYDVLFSVGEYDFPQSLAERYDSLEEYMSYPDEVIRVIAENQGESPIIYELYAGVTDEERLGYILVEEGLIIVPEHLRSYIDYEAIRRYHALNTGREFVDRYFVEFL